MPHMDTPFVQVVIEAFNLQEGEWIQKRPCLPEGEESLPEFPGGLPPGEGPVEELTPKDVPEAVEVAFDAPVSYVIYQTEAMELDITRFLTVDEVTQLVQIGQDYRTFLDAQGEEKAAFA